jgi:hypothetical protein
VHHQGVLGVIAIAAALTCAGAGAYAFDETKYPDLKGMWRGTGGTKWTPAGQKAPLTPEYQAIYEANLADQAAGGHGTDPTYTCLPPGMPRQMNVYEPMEIVVTAETTHLLMEHIHDSRRIYTDGRHWPEELEPAFRGHSIGKWIDEDGDGRYDVLEVETRGIKGPRSFDSTGLPLHEDNQTVVKERIYLDKANTNLLHNEITTIDHALTRPWTVMKNYRRAQSKEPIWWRESICAENNPHVRIGKDDYFVSFDGYLMPVRKDQTPPDLKYFKQSQK